MNKEEYDAYPDYGRYPAWACTIGIIIELPKIKPENAYCLPRINYQVVVSGERPSSSWPENNSCKVSSWDEGFGDIIGNLTTWGLSNRNLVSKFFEDNYNNQYKLDQKLDKNKNTNSSNLNEEQNLDKNTNLPNIHEKQKFPEPEKTLSVLVNQELIEASKFCVESISEFLNKKPFPSQRLEILREASFRIQEALNNLNWAKK